ncbi:MAG: amidohydrolase family protein [Acidobacteria bacterium]|nr:amidohydrolase family protein [Acidobacteriota bacterium]MYA47534.1 amidohydrolase family protein [Acidobacteriota bacterium]MYI39197.1 amidohydrolase family protein [Acidobacteriota bacterium]
MSSPIRSGATLIAALLLTATAPAQDRLALVGGMLLDGYDVPPLHHAAVLIEGDRIVAVGRAAEMEIPPNTDVVDTRGRVMMPGMMDLHAHLAVLGHGEYGRWFSWIDEEGVDIEDVMEISAKQLLLAGVTTAVDLGAPLEASLAVRDRIARGEVPGARLLMAGPWITRRVSFWPENYQIGISSPEEASAAVERLAEAGVDVIKAWVGLTREDYQAVADTAHRHGLRVHAHVYAPDDVRNALEGGIDVLTHAGSAGTPPYEPDLVRDIVVAGRPVVITGAHRVWVFPATVEFPERLQDPRLREDLPAAMYDELQRSFQNFHTLPYFQTTARQMFFGDASLGQWIEAGAVMGMGTDSGTPLNFHTEALWREIKAHVDLGMTPMEAMVAATRVNARILGLADELGTIEPGKIADIVVLRGDPRFSITELNEPVLVVKEGKVYRRD